MLFVLHFVLNSTISAKVGLHNLTLDSALRKPTSLVSEVVWLKFKNHRFLVWQLAVLREIYVHYVPSVLYYRLASQRELIAATSKCRCMCTGVRSLQFAINALRPIVRLIMMIIIIVRLIMMILTVVIIILIMIILIMVIILAIILEVIASTTIILRPISLLTSSLLTLLDSNFQVNSLWAWEFHPFELRLRSSQASWNPQCIL